MKELSNTIQSIFDWILEEDDNGIVETAQEFEKETKKVFGFLGEAYPEIKAGRARRFYELMQNTNSGYQYVDRFGFAYLVEICNAWNVIVPKLEAVDKIASLQDEWYTENYKYWGAMIQIGKIGGIDNIEYIPDSLITLVDIGSFGDKFLEEFKEICNAFLAPETLDLILGKECWCFWRDEPPKSDTAREVAEEAGKALTDIMDGIARGAIGTLQAYCQARTCEGCQFNNVNKDGCEVAHTFNHLQSPER